MFDVSAAKALCMRFEGFQSHPYLDPVGLPTIGYGTRFYADGTAVTMNDAPVTPDIAATILGDTLQQHYLPELLQISPVLGLLPHTGNAILDFSYNLGADRYRKSTLRQFVDKENWGAAKTEILKWDHAGGVELPGLKARRQAESDMIGTD